MLRRAVGYGVPGRRQKSELATGRVRSDGGTGLALHARPLPRDCGRDGRRYSFAVRAKRGVALLASGL